MSPALHSLRPRPYSTTLHPLRNALRTAFVAAVVGVTILLPAAWVLQWMS